MRRSIGRSLLVGASTLLMVGGTLSPAVAVEYDSSPSVVHSWTPNGRVYDILTVGDRLYIGGAFTSVRDPVTRQWADRDRLAAFDLPTGALLPWNPGANDRVRALAAGPGGTVYAGGLFTSAAGTSDTNVIAINPGGEAVNGFRTTTSGEVRDLLVTDGGLFVAGRFGNVNGHSRVGVARVNSSTGDLVTDFNARLSGGRVNALDVGIDGSVVMGGNFTAVAGRNQQYLARVTPGVGADSGWAPSQVCDTCLLLDLVAHTDGRIYAAVAGGGGGRAAAWRFDSNPRLWVRRGDGDVQAVDAHDGRVYAGGHFGPAFDGQERHQLAVLDATSGALQDMTVAFTGTDRPGIWAIDADDDFLRLGGGFQGIVGSSAARYAAFPAQLP
jgi:trimeric autotransporter adhesin